VTTSVILVGLMGSGKTSVAQELGGQLGVQVFDTDRLVEKEAGMTVSQIFEASGEAVFRTLEFHALEQCLEEAAPVVIATGGGIVSDHRSRELLAAQSGVVYLKVSSGEAARRLEYETTNRPLLNDDVEGNLRSLEIMRGPLYEGVAALKVDVDTRSIEETAETITKWLKGQS